MNVMKRIEVEMERYPEGSANHGFLKQLHKKLEPDFLKESVRKELNESHADLSGSIEQYFEQQIIYAAALKAVDCIQFEQNESTADHLELFYLNLLKKHVLDSKSPEKLKFFEESRPLLTKMLKDKEKSKSVKQFSKLVEGNINEFCLKLSRYLFEDKLNTWEKNFDASIKKLSAKAALLDSEDIRFNGIAPELQTTLSLYYKELTDGIKILDQLLDMFQQKMENQLKDSQLAAHRSSHLQLKAECLELELQVSTYSKIAVEALTMIKQELKHKKECSEKFINKLNERLESFQILGPEYEQLVDNYQLLLEKIEKQKWAIEHLKADIASKQEGS